MSLTPRAGRADRKKFGQSEVVNLSNLKKASWLFWNWSFELRYSQVSQLIGSGNDKGGLPRVV